MASPLSTPLSPEFEVFHFKQRQGENLKDDWYRMMESYRNCTLEVNFTILLRKSFQKLVSLPGYDVTPYVEVVLPLFPL